MFINLTSTFRIFVCGLIFSTQIACAHDSLPALKTSPQSYEEAWAGYDPRKDPLEVKVFKEWEEDGVVFRCVKFYIGTFKGKKSYMAGIYGFPKGGKNLPGLVFSHGGGGWPWTKFPGSATPDAKRGYACIAIGWREKNPSYLADNGLPPEANTDWGAVNGDQTPAAHGIEPDNDKKIDPFPSARNNGYFFRTLAARRALTFLEQQAEVDPERLGFYGHSMGGTITLYISAIDSRIKAASPSAGPPQHKEFDDTLEGRTFSPIAAAKTIKCPMLFMSPSQDFHGLVEGLEWIMDQMPHKNFRITRSTPLQHKHLPASWTALDLWFESHLKGGFNFPGHPELQVKLHQDKYPVVEVIPDASMPISHVDIYYLRDGENSQIDKMGQVYRYWRHTEGEKNVNGYVGSLNISGISKSLWVYADVHYKLENPQKYNLRIPSDTFNLTTRIAMISADKLKTSGVKYSTAKSPIIESFTKNWEKEWWNLNNHTYSTLKLNHSSLLRPKDAVLAVKFKAAVDTQIGISAQIGPGFGPVYTAEFPVKQSAEVQTLFIKSSDMKFQQNRKRKIKDPGPFPSWADDSRPIKFTIMPGKAEMLEISLQKNEASDGNTEAN